MKRQAETQIALNEFAEGALQEKFDREFQKVMANIQDLNTDFKKPRKIVLEMTFKTDEDRDLSLVTIVAKSTLAQSKEATAKILIGMDGKGGFLANELDTQIKGQQRMRVDEETGEILNDTETNLNGIKLVK